MRIETNFEGTILGMASDEYEDKKTHEIRQNHNVFVQQGAQAFTMRVQDDIANKLTRATGKKVLFKALYMTEPNTYFFLTDVTVLESGGGSPQK